MKGGGSSKGGGASKGGNKSVSKSVASKGAAKPAAKSGSSAAGKTINTSATRSNAGGGGGFMSGVRNAVKSAVSGGKKINTVTDPKTGQTYAKPSFGAMSLKGLTSNDPANVARNRAAAAKYAALEAARPRSEMGKPEPVAKPTVAPAPTTPTAPVTPTMVYTPPPAGYRPGVDPEHKFYQPQPTVTLAKGGRVKPKRTK